MIPNDSRTEDFRQIKPVIAPHVGEVDETEAQLGNSHRMADVYLRRAAAGDVEELDAAFKRSAAFHEPWIHAPDDIKRYAAQPHLFLLCLSESDAIAGAFNISAVVRGHFHSAFLGFQAFVPYEGKGYMRAGLSLLLKEAFETLGLHRLEANIQPGNRASIALVSKAGFKREGFSPKYLRVGGDWRDHERWAIVNDAWRAPDGDE